MSKSANILFDDMFQVTNVDGNKYERVSRLQARSTNFGMDLTLDFHHELYPLRAHDTITLVLASSLKIGDTTRTAASGINAEGTGEDKADRESWRPSVGPSKGLDADYEYVMYGKIYKFDEGAGERVTAYISYGGLLMALSGSYRHMSGIVLGENVYLLIRKR
ncbi:RNA polymerase [Serendipita vermifera]|nr:RNA polymerase [Serendipita vermifera]